MSGNMLDTTCSAVVNATTVNCSAQGIADLTGIQYFDNLHSLICSYNPITNIPQFPPALWRLDCNTNMLTILPSFPSSMDTIKCFNNQLTNLPTLPGSLIYLDCNTNQISGLPLLPSLLTYLHCGSNQLISLPSLPGQLYHLNCKDNQITALPTLPNALGDLECENNQLSSLPLLPNALFYLNCGTNLLVNLPTLPNSLYFLLCPANQITNLPTLPPTLNQLVCFYNSLTSLPSLPSSLNELNCFSNHLTSLPVLPNSLMELSCGYNQLDSIPTLPPSLRIFTCYNNLLTTLPLLPNSIIHLGCSSNQLTSLPELPDSLNILDCYDNPDLFCLPQLKRIVNLSFTSTGITCLPNYGNVTNSNPPLITVPLCGIFNPSGCSAFWNISGKSYYDSNSNCLFDSADVGQANSHIKLYENGVLQQQAFTGGEGYFSFQVANAANYTTEIDTASLPFDVLCPSSLTVNDTITATDTLFYSNDFSLKCKPGFDVGVLSIQACVFRPVHQTVVNIHAGDISNFYGAHCAAGIAGSVTIKISGSASFVSPALGALTPDIVSGDSLYYIIPDFGTVNFNTAFNIIVVTDTFAVIGSQICVTVLVLPLSGDINVNNNRLAHCFTVVSSYDPNDKQVNPISWIDIAGDKWLTYTINFQNTGTAEAEHIYITDTLDSNLDLSSFQLIGYSHQPLVQILEGGIARFNFPNINLPDSNTNEPASHGYVQYKIKFKSSISLWTQIHNTAYIYFDFNSPVITNTVSTTITDATGINESQSNQNGLNIYPNPAKGEFTLSFSNHTGEKALMKIYNIIGETVFQKRFTVSSSFTLNNSSIDLQKGMYVVEVSFENYSEKKKLLIE